MSTNPYQAPTANVEISEPELEVPVEIAKKIKNGWMAGLITVVITLIFVLISLFGTSILGIDAWALVDVGVMAGLTFGVFRKSRTCAVLLLGFFVLNKVLMWMESGTATGLPITLIFCWFFVQSVVGTFQYHSWKREAQNSENA
jgi:serine/threonine-protein kinase